MTLSTLTDVLRVAREEKVFVVGFVVQGWEDAKAFVEAASETNSNIILQAGPAFRNNMHLEAIARMFETLAKETNVKVVAHLDHGNDFETCKRALDVGFTSVMFDGSRLPFQDNLNKTAKVCDIAKKYEASVEAELGFVGYENIELNKFTCPEEVGIMTGQLPIDALAISIGNTHLQSRHLAEIDYKLLAEIRAVSSIPLVIHGGSGVSPDDRIKMAREFGVLKFNIGTEFRQLFGQSLRDFFAEDKVSFDRFEIMKSVQKNIKNRAISLLQAFN